MFETDPDPEFRSRFASSAEDKFSYVAPKKVHLSVDLIGQKEIQVWNVRSEQ